MSKRKRKKAMQNSNDSSESSCSLQETEESCDTLPYVLKRMKAIQKKLDSSYRKESFIEIKGSVSNPQVVISLDTARYEILKNVLPKQLAAAKSVLKITPNKLVLVSALF